MSIRSEWESYRQELINRSAGAVQIHETCLAFWAGAVAMYRLMIDATGETEQEAMRRLSAFDAELKEFGANVPKDGRLLR